MKARLRYIAVLILPAILVAGCGTKETAEEQPVRPIRAMKVADYDGLAGRSFPGRAEATQEVDLAFRVAGPLIALPVMVGDQVKEGDTVASIDPRDFQVSLQNVQANLDRARSTQKRAQDDLARFKQLRSSNPDAITEQRLVAATEAVQVANADVAALEASVRTASDSLEDTNLQAPFAGTIVATYVENFENVREKQMILRLLDKTRIEFEVSIPETLISMVPHMEEIRVTYDAFPDVEVPAEIKEIGTEASETTRTFPVTLIMDQPEGIQILPGMTGRATGTAKRPEDETQAQIVIPVTSVFSPDTEDQSFVWVIDEPANSVTRRPVEIGKLISGGYIVNSGVEAGEMIATAGVHFLKEGQQVEPIIQ